MLNNPLLQVWLSCVKKIKPVHSIPGRLRVNIYGIRQYPELAQEYASVLLDKTRHLPGVQSAELSVLTGNILLTYDVRKTTEHELLERLNTAWTALRRTRHPAGHRGRGHAQRQHDTRRRQLPPHFLLRHARTHEAYLTVRFGAASITGRGFLP